MELNRINSQRLSQNTKTMSAHLGGAESGRSTRSGSSDTAALADWYEQATLYYSAVVSGDPQTEKPSQEAWQEFLNQMNFAYQKLNGSWDPMANVGLPGTGLDQDGFSQAGSDEAPLPEGAKTGTMNNILWYRTKAEISFDGESRTQDVMSQDITFNIPDDLSLKVNLAVTPDSRLKPPVDVLKVEMKDGSGKTSVYYIHDFDTKKPVFRVPEGNEILKNKIEEINKSHPGLVSVETYDPSSPESAAQVSIPAPETINGERVWKKGNAVQYFATPGKETDKIYLDAIEFNVSDRTHTVKVTKTGAHKYTIQVFDPAVSTTVPIRTVYTEQSDNIHFKGIDAGNITYTNVFNPKALPEKEKPESSNAKMRINQAILQNFELVDGEFVPKAESVQLPAAESKTWDEFTASPDEQITVEGFDYAEGSAGSSSSGSGKPSEPINPEGDNDTAPTDIEVGVATYKNLDEVELTALYSDEDDAIDRYEIKNALDVVLNSAGERDRVLITKKSDDNYTITFKSNGGEQVFHVTGEDLESIVIDAKVENVKYKDEAAGTGEANYAPGMDLKIAVKGEKYPESIGNLAKWFEDKGETSQTEAKLYKDAKDAGLTDADLQYPPMPPNAAMLEFLKIIDPTLVGLLTSHKDHLKDRDEDRANRSQIRDRLVDLLKQVYPKQNVGGGTDSNANHAADDISIGGIVYDVIKNEGGSIRFGRGDSADM